jgi:hypothetical protein
LRGEIGVVNYFFSTILVQTGAAGRAGLSTLALFGGGGLA